MSFVDLFSLTPSRPSLLSPPRHRRLYIYLALLFTATLFAAVQQGTAKATSEIDWVDVVGEGLTWMAGLAWLYFIVAWRPPGPVTRWLTTGFALLSYGFYLDVLDEFIRFNNTLWGQSFESIFTPAAIAVLTMAAFSLHGEQRVLNRLQQRREAHFRDHQAIDHITNLYNADYCRQTLDADIAAGQPPAVWLIDLHNFDAINRRFGFATGDAVLNRVAATLVATVPVDSLVCRYAGDRFAVLTRRRSLALKLDTTLGQLLSNATSLALYDSTGQDVACAVRVTAVEPAAGEDAARVLHRANSVLQAQK